MNLVFSVLIIAFIGFWFGCGVAPALLIWTRNRSETVPWKAMHSLDVFIRGPINYFNTKRWLR
jgi:hypothetical protein